ncbi:MAG: MFS transporter [Anaerolineae bacterium]|nr:MFS transporter [Anaerolineae bacterium]
MRSTSASRAILKNPAFRRLCGQMFASATGVYAIYYASVVMVEDITHASAQMGLLIFASTLPGFLLGPWAGVVVDRYERIGVLTASNGLRVVGGLGFLFALRRLEPPLLLPAIYLCNFAQGSLNQFVAAAEGAILPRLVRSEQLLGANSLLGVVLLAAEGTGLVVLGPSLWKVGGAQAVVWSAILLGLVSIPLSASLPREKVVPSAKQARALVRAWADLKAGWRFVATDRPTFLATLQWALASSISLMLSTLAPGLVARGLGMPVENTAYMLVPVGIGVGSGMALVGQRGNRRPNESWIATGLLILGGTLASLSLLYCVDEVWRLPFLLIVALGVGFGFALVSIPAATLLQERPPERMRGRVIATRLVLSNAASTLPLPLVGALADQIGIWQTVLLLALLALGAGAGNVHHARAASFTSASGTPDRANGNGEPEPPLR